MQKRKDGGRNSPPSMGPTTKFFIFEFSFGAKTNMIMDGKWEGCGLNPH